MPFFYSWATGKSFIFSYKSYAGHPGFYRFRALDSLQFFLEHSLEEPCKSSAKKVLNSDTTGFSSTDYLLVGVTNRLVNNLF